MKVVVIGGSGLIGSNVVQRLSRNGHEVFSASLKSGVNIITGAGLADALRGAQVVVDVSNSPSFADDAVMAFFQTAGRNLVAAEEAAGVEHHLALSVVGTERLQESGYFRAKAAQEALIKASPIPYTLLRATQFFEFIGGIVDSCAHGDELRVSPALIQPVAADDVSAVLADLAAGVPLNDTVEVAGPDRFPLDELARKYLARHNDTRKVIADVHARYFGSELDDRTLVAGDGYRVGPTRFINWLASGASSRHLTPGPALS
ncbi:SDR family oxidoreductase [Achromobacter aloeverae]|uniref:NmrA family transcriptional regulator n=1 Tax=Achromobacter aloeverae TaxID=1750518 RepID=A0A4Q1HLQ6_9BURK|nr:SDR family oxidoreductase [Achromobacter aloeverae]RXN91196.1 NmrA family transcriptional regulator [Achromobacter aloeverae]